MAESKLIGLKRKRLYESSPPKEGDKKNNRFLLCPKSSEKKKKNSENKLSTSTKLAQKVENTIMSYSQKIKSAEEELVDLDYSNSAFIRSEKMKTRFMRFVSECYEEDDIKPTYVVYKKIKLKSELVPFPTLVQAVEKFINTSCIQYGERIIPSCKEVKAVIEKWNTHNKLLTVNDVNYYCKNIMNLIISDIRKKRRKDLDVVLNRYVNAENNDPAKIDPLLADKLVRNQNSKIEMKNIEASFMNGEKLQFSPGLWSNGVPKLEEPIIKTEPLS